MTRNFGGGSRDVVSAAVNLLNELLKRGAMAHGTIAAYKSDWSSFSRDYLKLYRIRKLEDISREDVISYGEMLAADVYLGEISSQTAHGRISAINTVLGVGHRKFGKNWVSVSACDDCDIPKRSFIRNSAPLIDVMVAEELLQRAVEFDQDAGHVASLAWHFGLRRKEASLLDVHKALRQIDKKGHFTVERGTKGGRIRKAFARTPEQRQALENAAKAQGKRSCLIPVHLDFYQFQSGPIRRVNEILEKYGLSGYHELRASFACRLYKVLSGTDAPCVTSLPPANRELDRETRLAVSKELGHTRIEAAGAYIGGAK